MGQTTLEKRPGAGNDTWYWSPQNNQSKSGKRKKLHLRREKKSPKRIAIEILVMLLVAAGLSFVVRTWALQVYMVPSSSMVPTIQPGDRIVVNKILFNYHDLHTGDIVVFKRPPKDVLGICAGPEINDLVKRVIALPGQTIYSRGNTIYVNGHRLAQPWLPAGTQLGRPIQPPVTVPAGQYYVMGDNRSISCDSRYWGTIKGTSIVGRVIAVVWRHGRPYWHSF